jgi:hypothetical protein
MKFPVVMPDDHLVSAIATVSVANVVCLAPPVSRPQQPKVAVLPATTATQALSKASAETKDLRNLVNQLLVTKILLIRE